MTNSESTSFLDKVEALRREKASIEGKAFNLSKTTKGDEKNFAFEDFKIIASATTRLIALETKMVKAKNAKK